MSITTARDRAHRHSGVDAALILTTRIVSWLTLALGIAALAQGILDHAFGSVPPARAHLLLIVISTAATLLGGLLGLKYRRCIGFWAVLAFDTGVVFWVTSDYLFGSWNLPLAARLIALGFCGGFLIWYGIQRALGYRRELRKTATMGHS